jgi:hypothetical protein
MRQACPRHNDPEILYGTEMSSQGEKPLNYNELSPKLRTHLIQLFFHESD